MKYKVGDKVKINSLVWYNKNRNEYSSVVQNGISFTYSMSEYCGKIATIMSIGSDNDLYIIDIDKGEWCWYDWMLEDEFEVQKDKDLIPNVLNAESLEEKRFHAACSAMNGILSTEYSKPIPNDKIIQMSYMLADELLKQCC